ncbi:MAG: twin-arginine translocation signal domain-containing protein [Planctomycetes bacterium]|nr:twin-arginine translocation signal domain-containing protein [Planctomycetota bacterium]
MKSKQAAKRRVSRREFLTSTAAGAVGLAAGLSAPAWLPGARITGEGGAANRIATGHIGVGGRGGSVLGMARGRSDVSVAAVCDVDRNHLGAAVQAAGGKAEGYGDYRKILDRKDVDAVVVVTPDHWHALASISPSRWRRSSSSRIPISRSPGRSPHAAATFSPARSTA